MNFRKDVGKVSQGLLLGERFDWRIDDFFTYPLTSDTQILSPEFHFENQSCFLGIWTSVDEDNKDEENADGMESLGSVSVDSDNEADEWIGVYFWISPKIMSTHRIHVKLGVQFTSGKEFKSCSVSCKDDNPRVLSYEQPQLVRKKDFLDELNTNVPVWGLTVFCEIRKDPAGGEPEPFDGLLAA